MRQRFLFKIGFFDPSNTAQALSALEIMDFDGKNAIEAKIRELSQESINQPKGAEM